MKISSRIEAIDMLRGLVILLMALDHTRDFFGHSGMNPRDIHEPWLFMTRWVTHLCAPTFIFLAGISIYLWEQRHSKKEASRFILFRGLWLIFLEFTLVRVGWTFDVIPGFMLAQVIWVLGVSMVLMSLTLYLPVKWLALLSLIMIGGHNVFDKMSAEKLTAYKDIWRVLHEPALLNLGKNVELFITYPLIPWLAVMSLGYCCGRFFLQAPASRIRYYLIFGITSLALFSILRFSNEYGDPMPWIDQGTISTKILSFINCEKYPPSLLYLLMTLGVASLLLVFMEKATTGIRQFLVVFGRVPLLFYLVHLPLIHGYTIIFAVVKGEKTEWLFKEPFFSKPVDYGYNLSTVYVIWIIVIAFMYPVCVKYWRFKQKHSNLSLFFYIRNKQ